MDRVIKLFATGLGLGYLPKAPGTFGTLLGVPLFWALAGLPLIHYITFLMVFIVLSSWISDRAQALFGVDDPKTVVIDEVAGFLVAVAGHPFGWKTVLIAFALFRVFDIVKPFPVRTIDDRMHNGFGIVLDDVLAGVYANVCLIILSSLRAL
ncbi:MAG: phosphatidylglycerophosphatase A [Deltaproteobacteria bacterium CG11_big_fil_rev_8_21_14_0_20_49_13]|nr:MAG: phosphatidylglycerophosphatase A [Deltaproteobacteria bacterium CG11_big_fil_rev_8_21_14_0_20_49_13]